MVIKHFFEARHHGIAARIALNLGRVYEQFLAPDKPGIPAQPDDLIEESTEDLKSEPLPDPGQGGVVGERLIEVVAHIPTMREIQRSPLDELSLGANALEHHDQLELEEHDWIDAGPTSFGVAILNPVANKGEIQDRFEMPVDVVRREQGFEADQRGNIEVA
jgi:hypothetical protein